MEFLFLGIIIFGWIAIAVVARRRGQSYIVAIGGGLSLSGFLCAEA